MPRFVWILAVLLPLALGFGLGLLLEEHVPPLAPLTAPPRTASPKADDKASSWRAQSALELDRLLSSWPGADYSAADAAAAGQVVTGRVLTDGGTPIEGAELVLVSREYPPGYEWSDPETDNLERYVRFQIEHYRFDHARVRRARSDGDGWFSFEGVVDGLYRLMAEKPGWAFQTYTPTLGKIRVGSAHSPTPTIDDDPAPEGTEVSPPSLDDLLVVGVRGRQLNVHVYNHDQDELPWAWLSFPGIVTNGSGKPRLFTARSDRRRPKIWVPAEAMEIRTLGPENGWTESEPIAFVDAVDLRPLDSAYVRGTLTQLALGARVEIVVTPRSTLGKTPAEIERDLERARRLATRVQEGAGGGGTVIDLGGDDDEHDNEYDYDENQSDLIVHRYATDAACHFEVEVHRPGQYALGVLEGDRWLLRKEITVGVGDLELELTLPERDPEETLVVNILGGDSPSEPVRPEAIWCRLPEGPWIHAQAGVDGTFQLAIPREPSKAQYLDVRFHGHQFTSVLIKRAKVGYEASVTLRPQVTVELELSGAVPLRYEALMSLLVERVRPRSPGASPTASPSSAGVVAEFPFHGTRVIRCNLQPGPYRIRVLSPAANEYDSDWVLGTWRFEVLPPSSELTRFEFALPPLFTASLAFPESLTATRVSVTQCSPPENPKELVLLVDKRPSLSFMAIPGETITLPPLPAGHYRIEVSDPEFWTRMIHITGDQEFPVDRDPDAGVWVYEGSPGFDKLDVRVGDRLLRWDDTPIRSDPHFNSLLLRLPARESKLEIERNGRLEVKTIPALLEVRARLDLGDGLEIAPYPSPVETNPRSEGDR